MPTNTPQPPATLTPLPGQPAASTLPQSPIAPNQPPKAPQTPEELQIVMDNGKKILEDAKFKMAMTNQVFIISVGLSLKWVLNPELGAIAATDGMTIFWDPNILVQLPPADAMFILYHEIWHVCFNHMERIEDTSLDKGKWNKAADYVINAQLIEKANLKMPSGEFAGLYDKRYSGMSTHEIYDLLPDEPTQPNGAPQPNAGNMGDLLPTPGNTPQQVADNKQQIKETIIQAATQAKLDGEKSFGDIPSDIKLLIEELLNPMLPWPTILQNYMSAYNKQDYSWARPNKRFMPDMYLPSLYSEAIGEIAVAIDTSGSVSDDEFMQFISEIHTIQSELNPSKLTVIDFDTRVNNTYELTENNDISDLQFTGRGGTNLEPVFELYSEKQPQVLIVFSDLECREIQEDPGYDVIWIVVNNERAHVNFGDMIHINT